MARPWGASGKLLRIARPHEWQDPPPPAAPPDAYDEIRAAGGRSGPGPVRWEWNPRGRPMTAEEFAQFRSGGGKINYCEARLAKHSNWTNVTNSGGDEAYCSISWSMSSRPGTLRATSQNSARLFRTSWRYPGMHGDDN
jgi:hypothetical protein